MTINDQQEPLPFAEGERFAYLAGIIDMGGSITMHPSGQIRVIVSMDEVAPMKIAKAMFGGRISRRESVSNQPRMTYYITGPEVLPLLKAVRPFLMAKSIQADIAIEYYERVDVNRRKHQHRTGEQVAEAEIFYWKLRAANRTAEKARNLVGTATSIRTSEKIQQLLEQLKPSTEEPK